MNIHSWKSLKSNFDTTKVAKSFQTLAFISSNTQLLIQKLSLIIANVLLQLFSGIQVYFRRNKAVSMKLMYKVFVQSVRISVRICGPVPHTLIKQEGLEF